MTLAPLCWSPICTEMPPSGARAPAALTAAAATNDGGGGGGDDGLSGGRRGTAGGDDGGEKQERYRGVNAEYSTGSPYMAADGVMRVARVARCYSAKFGMGTAQYKCAPPPLRATAGPLSAPPSICRIEDGRGSTEDGGNPKTTSSLPFSSFAFLSNAPQVHWHGLSDPERRCARLVRLQTCARTFPLPTLPLPHAPPTPRCRATVVFGPSHPSERPSFLPSQSFSIIPIRSCSWWGSRSQPVGSLNQFAFLVFITLPCTTCRDAYARSIGVTALNFPRPGTAETKGAQGWLSIHL